MKMKNIWLAVFSCFFTLAGKTQKIDGLHLVCPLNEAVVVPPSYNIFHYDEPDLCIVLMSKPDTTVKACINGRVTNVEKTEDGKWDVVFCFNDYYFWYSGLSKVIVKRNEVIRSGQPVGYITAGEQMEMLLFKFETPLDPVKYLDCKMVLRN